MLAPYWAEKLHKQIFRARQCSPRGGDLGVTINPAAARVVLSGDACIVLQGRLRVE